MGYSAYHRVLGTRSLKESYALCKKLFKYCKYTGVPDITIGVKDISLINNLPLAVKNHTSSVSFNTDRPNEILDQLNKNKDVHLYSLYSPKKGGSEFSYGITKYCAKYGLKEARNRLHVNISVSETPATAVRQLAIALELLKENKIIRINKDLDQFSKELYDLSIEYQKKSKQLLHHTKYFAISSSGFFGKYPSSTMKPISFTIAFGPSNADKASTINKIFSEYLGTNKTTRSWTLFKRKSTPAPKLEFNMRAIVPLKDAQKIIEGESQTEGKVERFRMSVPKEALLKKLVTLFDKDTKNMFTIQWAHTHWLGKEMLENWLIISKNYNNQNSSYKKGVDLLIGINGKSDYEKIAKELKKKSGLKLKHVFTE
jgi:hypothetical protein